MLGFIKKFQILSFIALNYTTILPGIAGTPEIMSSAKMNSPFYPVIRAELGASTAQIGQSHIFNIDGDFTTYVYHKDDERSVKALVGLFAGIENKLTSLWIFQAGLAFYQNASFIGRGLLMQGVDPDSSDVFSYQYKVQSQQLLLEARILSTFVNRWHPYISFGLGGAKNKAKDYRTFQNPFITFTPQYTNNTSTSLAGMVGLGLERDVGAHWRAGAGIQYHHSEEVSLGTGTLDIQLFPRTLSQQHLNIFSVLFQISYIS
ncbi:hypothetical protein EP47_10560 [Legionella norrlandica]|uniref:Outer membrane protein beta-barrel domain-containing protein n=1 Tax=Legionella norrlandica TaxID=1498499 RepID=A0A0A2ST63_9GAMM|nr:outer membrane beta-barrel protein [Legionella norrlandica]KGP62659.1 hypothetical protein EP47_10560 [Legionella norrlandica]